MKVKILIIILVIGNILLLNKIITMNVSNLKSETVDLIPLEEIIFVH